MAQRSGHLGMVSTEPRRYVERMARISAAAPRRSLQRSGPKAGDPGLRVSARAGVGIKQGFMIAFAYGRSVIVIMVQNIVAERTLHRKTADLEFLIPSDRLGKRPLRTARSSPQG